MLFNFKIEALFLPPENVSQAQSVHALSTNAWANLDKRSRTATRHKPAAMINAAQSVRRQVKVAPVPVDGEGRLLRQSVECVHATTLVRAGSGEVALTTTALTMPPCGGFLEAPLPSKPVAELSVAQTEPFVSPVNDSKDETVMQPIVSDFNTTDHPLAKEPNDVFASIHAALSKFHSTV